MPYLGRSLALEAEKEESSSPMSFKSVLKDTHKDQTRLNMLFIPTRPTYATETNLLNNAKKC